MKNELWIWMLGAVVAGFSSVSYAERVEDIFIGGNVSSSGKSASLVKTEPSTARREASAPFRQEESAESLEREIEESTIDNEVVDADILALEQINSDTEAETKALKQEIVSLDRQLVRLKSSSARAQKQAEISFKKLELQRRLKGEAQKRVSAAERLERQKDQKLSVLRDRVRKMERLTSALNAKNRQTQSSIAEIRRETLQLEKQLRKLEGQKLREQNRQKKLRLEQARWIERQKRAKTRVQGQLAAIR